MGCLVSQQEWDVSTEWSALRCTQDIPTGTILLRMCGITPIIVRFGEQVCRFLFLDGPDIADDSILRDSATAVPHTRAQLQHYKSAEPAAVRYQPRTHCCNL